MPLTSEFPETAIRSTAFPFCYIKRVNITFVTGRGSTKEDYTPVLRQWLPSLPLFSMVN